MRLVSLGPLDPLADHVDGADQLAALGGVLAENLVQVELAVAGLGEQPAADLLGAVVPEPGIEPGVPPADRAVPLDVADQVGLGRLGRQRGQADDQGHRSRPRHTGREAPPGSPLETVWEPAFTSIVLCSFMLATACASCWWSGFAAIYQQTIVGLFLAENQPDLLIFLRGFYLNLVAIAS